MYFQRARADNYTIVKSQYKRRARVFTYYQTSFACDVYEESREHVVESNIAKFDPGFAVANVGC